jgi:hypothetical protein
MKDQKVGGYEKPVLVVLGSFRGLTATGGAGILDGWTVNGAPSSDGTRS